MMELLRCLFLPMLGKTLIVPYSAVAEVLPYKGEENKSLTSNTLPARWNWRGIEIPIIYLEKQADKDLKNTSPASLHIAILNRCLASEGPDFIGILLQSLPSMSRCKRADIQAVSASDKPYLSGEVTVKGKAAFIPNLTWIWKNLTSLQSAAAI